MRAQQLCRHYIRTQYLITTGGVWFCLLCCQTYYLPGHHTLHYKVFADHEFD
jgi:hypothetical protein